MFIEHVAEFILSAKSTFEIGGAIAMENTREILTCFSYLV